MDKNKEINAENLKEFLNGFLNAKTAEYFKSEPIPETNDKPVKKVVYDNFHDIVLDETKDVLVFWYSPYCTVCESIAPIYEELASKLLVVKNLILARFDGIHNDSPEFPVNDFPAIKFFPARNKDHPVTYNGEKTVEGLVNFLKGKATWAKWPKNSEEL